MANSLSLALPRRRSGRRLNITLGCGLLIAALLSVFLGSAPLSLSRVVMTLAGHGDWVETVIVFDLRLPRAVLSVAVGAAFGLGGAVLQGYLRNPLADPSVLGLSNAAALGAVIVIYAGLAGAHPMLLPLGAITGAVLALFALFWLAGFSGGPLDLILGGIAISTLAAAGISLALNLSPNPFAAMEITTWLLGSLENRSVEHVWIALPCILLALPLLLQTGRALDALSLGEETAASLGIGLHRTRIAIAVAIAVGTGSAVAVSGAIGFVGLVVPHIIRPLVRGAPSSILLPSILAGGILLTLADIAVRLIPTTNELKLGVVMAFIGVPIFIRHLVAMRRVR